MGAQNKQQHQHERLSLPPPSPVQNAFITTAFLFLATVFYIISLVIGFTAVAKSSYSDLHTAAPLSFFPRRELWFGYIAIIGLFAFFFLLMIIKRWTVNEVSLAKSVPVPSIMFTGALALSSMAMFFNFYDITLWLTFSFQLVAFLAYFFVVMPTRFMSNPIEGLWDDDGVRKTWAPIDYTAPVPEVEFYDNFGEEITLKRPGSLRKPKTVKLNRKQVESQVEVSDFKRKRYVNRFMTWLGWFDIQEKYNGWPLDRRSFLPGMIFAWEAIALAATISKCVMMVSNDADKTLLVTSIIFPIISATVIFFSFLSWSWGGLLGVIFASLFFCCDSPQLLWWGIGAAGISGVSFIWMAYIEITNVDYNTLW